MSDVSLSITNVSLTLGQGQTGPARPARAAFQQLAKSLQSGDLAGAQQAFATLQQDAPKGAAGKGPLSTDIAGLGQALQSGDLAGAQKAFATLQQDAQKVGAGRGHHHHHHHGAQGTQPESTPPVQGSTSDQNDGRPQGLDLSV